MHVEILAFIAVMTMVAVGAWLNNKSLRVQQEANRLRSGGADADRRLEAITSENRELRDHVSYLEERIAVLERIATDPADRTAREIEKLR